MSCTWGLVVMDLVLIVYWYRLFSMDQFMVKKFDPRHTKSQISKNIAPAVRDAKFLDNRTWWSFPNAPDHPLFYAIQDYSIVKLNTWSAYYFILKFMSRKYTFLHGLAVKSQSLFSSCKSKLATNVQPVFIILASCFNASLLLYVLWCGARNGSQKYFYSPNYCTSCGPWSSTTPSLS